MKGRDGAIYLVDLEPKKNRATWTRKGVKGRGVIFQWIVGFVLDLFADSLTMRVFSFQKDFLNFL